MLFQYPTLADDETCSLILHACCFFFVQAEDGIRDLVRSRGLGDVYKRQALADLDTQAQAQIAAIQVEVDAAVTATQAHMTESVSYTHLTLPTSDLV